MKFKNISAWALALAGTALGVSSCSEDKLPDFIHSEDRQVTLETDGYSSTGDAALVVLAANSDWHVTKKDEWISISKESGTRGRHNLFITAEPNVSSKSRLGFIEIAMGGKKEQFAVTQHGFEYVFEIDKKEVELDIDGNPVTTGANHIKLNTNSKWTVSIAAEYSWLSATPAEGEAGEGEFVITALENTTGEERTGSVSVCVGDLVEEVSVTQSGTRVSYDNKPLGFTYFADSMDWATGGNDQVGSVNGENNKTLPIYSDANAGIKAEFDKRYIDFNAKGASVYAAAGYLKFGKSGNQNAFMLKEPLGIDEGKKANVEVSFRFAKNATDKITLSVAIEGPGSIEGGVNEEMTLSAPLVTIDNTDKNINWQWKNFTVKLKDITSETKIIIGETQYIIDGFKTRSGYYRGFIDDIKVTRTAN